MHYTRRNNIKMGWVMQSASVSDLEKLSLAMLKKECSGHTKEWISQHINSQTTAYKQAIIAAAKDENNHAAYAYSALLCDDIYHLNTDRLTAAITYLEQYEGIEVVINTLKISRTFLAYNNIVETPVEIKKEAYTTFLEELKTLLTSEPTPLVILPRAELPGLDLSGKRYDLSYANLSNCILDGANFGRCDLNFANCHGCFLNATIFSDCDLSHADLSNCNLAPAIFGKATMRDTIFLRDNKRLNKETLESFLSMCAEAKISARLVLTNLIKNARSSSLWTEPDSNEEKKYSNEEKLILLKAAVGHPYFLATAKKSIFEEDKICKQEIHRQIAHVEAALKYEQSAKKYVLGGDNK